MEMKSVWVIEEGVYSDYHVVGVFSSREKAEEVFAWCGLDPNDYDEPRIVEWKLDPGVDEIHSGLTQWSVCMAADGTVERVKADEPSSFALRYELRPWQRTRAPAFRGDPDVQDAVVGNVFARDAEHAIKVANERRVALLASGGIESP